VSSTINPNRASNLHQSETVERPYWLPPEDDQQDNESSRHVFSQAVASLLRSLLRPFPLLRVFLLELRSLVYRIGLQYKRRYDLYGLDGGPLHEKTSSGHLRWNIRTRACSEDMQSFESSRPWATMLDWEVYRDAWVKGAEWAESNFCKSGQDKLSRESSSNSGVNNSKSQPGGLA
jgi:hypothetical protein